MKEPERNFSPESIDQMTERLFNELPEQYHRLVEDLYQTYAPFREENSRSLQRIWSRFAQAQEQYVSLEEGQRESGSATRGSARTPAARLDTPVPGSFQRLPQPLARRSRRSFWWRFGSGVSAAVILLALVGLLLLTRTFFMGTPQTTLGASLSLNEGPQTDQNIVFLVKSSEIGQYLAEISFDTYNGRSWSNGAVSSSLLPANKRTNSEATSVHLVTQQITVVNSPAELRPYIFGAGQIASVNQTTTVLANKKTGSQIAVLLNNGKSLGAGEQFTVQSYVSSASAAQLIAASVILPPYAHPPAPSDSDAASAIYQTYLQLPSNLDPRILAKAQEVTAGAKSLYEMAVDLEKYLRTNYIYNTNINLPPGQESVSWLLFHSGKQGFCNYFATAMTIMARELRMPARVVVGYTSGTYDAKTQTWAVRGLDAHAWTQIYFDGYGWINFEPSPSFPMFVRPL